MRSDIDGERYVENNKYDLGDAEEWEPVHPSVDTCEGCPDWDDINGCLAGCEDWCLCSYGDEEDEDVLEEWEMLPEEE